MGFFKNLKKLSLGGLVAQKLTGSKDNQGSFALGVLDPHYDKPVENKFDPGARPGASINGQSGVDQPAQRLGWTNNGRQYANSPFNGANPSYYKPPMSMGGGAPPPTPSSGMGASGPQTIPLPPQGGGGSMPPAGAQPPGMGAPPTNGPNIGLQPNPQLMQAMMIRNRNGGGIQ